MNTTTSSDVLNTDRSILDRLLGGEVSQKAGFAREQAYLIRVQLWQRENNRPAGEACYA